MLNLIEESFSVIKSFIKPKLSTTYRPRVLNIAGARYGDKSRLRKQLLSEVLEEAIETLTPNIIENQYNHLISILFRATREEDL